MPEQESQDLISIKLDAERRREIDEVRKSFEGHWRDQVQFQSDMKNRMDIVSSKQDGLKERFEIGTARTLKELKDKFDIFLMEWGKKQEQDKNRDETIKETRSNLNWLIRSLIISVCGGALGWIIVTAISNFKG